MHPPHSTPATQAAFETAPIIGNQPLARRIHRLRLAAPHGAARALPGQFFMVRLSGQNDPLIGRALALYDCTEVSDQLCLDLVYLVDGKLTTRLAQSAPGVLVDVWGPLGNGFVPQPTRRLILVAGGIGYTPFLAVAQERLGQKRYGQPRRQAPPAQQVILCFGARTAAQLASVDEFLQVGVDVRICTDDGSRGRRAQVTTLLEEVLAEDCPANESIPSAGAATRRDTHVLCCGPEPMMEAVAQLAAQTGTPCEVSLETPMACGIGICFTCVAAVRDKRRPEGWDYQRTCLEGPVFDATRIVW